MDYSVRREETSLGPRSPNVLWMQLDSLRPDFLPEQAAGGTFPGKSLFDGLRGTLFSNVISVAPYTLASVHSAFSGQVPAVHGVDGWLVRPERRANPAVPTLFDVAKFRGYRTQVICSPNRQFFPGRSLDAVHFVESRTEVIDRIKTIQFTSSAPVFTYIHLDWLHDKRLALGPKGTVEEFRAAYRALLPDFREILLEIAVSASDWIVSSDHGMLGSDDEVGLLQEDFTGNSLSNLTLRTFAWVSEDIKRDSLEVELRSVLDIFPTLSRFFGLKLHTPLSLDFARGAESKGRIVYSETGGMLSSPFKSDSFCIQDSRYKIVKKIRGFRKPRQEKWLMFDLASISGESRNIFWAEPALREIYLKQLADVASSSPRAVSEAKIVGKLLQLRSARRARLLPVVKKTLRRENLRFYLYLGAVLRRIIFSRLGVLVRGHQEFGWTRIR